MNKRYPYYDHQKISNLTELLTNSIKKNANSIAFFYNDKNNNLIKKTYQNFYDEIINLKNYLAQKYKKEHIALIAENSYEWLVTFFGIILSGNTVVIIDKDLPEETINKLLKQSDSRYAFYTNYCEYLSNSKIVKGLPLSKINDYIKDGKKEEIKIKNANNRCAVIFFTSGTTGANKAVMLSEKNIANNIYSASSLFKPNGSVISVLPFHHAFGLIIGVLAPLFYHCPIFLNTSLKTIMNDIKKSKPNTMFLVPVFVEKFYKQIMSTAKRQGKKGVLKLSIVISNILLKMGIDLRKKLFKTIIKEFGGDLEYIICGGAYLDKKYVRWFRSIGINLLNGYGITECSPVVSVNRNNYYKDGSVGQIIKDGKIKIENNEILFQSESVMLGYYKDEESTKKVLKNNWFYTGDFGYLDNDNFLFITGRKKNLIILNNGENVSPEVVEEELAHDKGVCEIVVYAKDNKIIASIYPNEEYLGNQNYFDKLIYNYNKGTPKNRQIAYAEIRSTEFPKNNNRKILRDQIGR